jgi:hypothetical protein
MADQTNLPEQRAIHVFASCRVRFEPMLLDSVDVGAGSTTMMRDLVRQQRRYSASYSRHVCR